MSSVAQVAEKMQEILTSTAERLGRSTGFIQRERAFNGASFAQTLVLGWMGNPAASLTMLSQSAANVSVEVSRQAIEQRFTEQAAAFMKSLLQAALQEGMVGEPVKVDLLRRFSGVYLLDSTCIGLPESLQAIWPGCGGSQGPSACLKVSVLWEMLRGDLKEVELLPGKTHDQRALAAQQSLPAKSLRVSDLGYFKLSLLKRLSREGGYWLTRYKNGTVLWCEGQRLEVLKALQDQTETQVEWEVEVGLRDRLPARLLARRVSAAVLERRAQRLADWERKKQCRASAQTWTLLAWDLFLTNVPQALLSAAEAFTLAHYRWQIELLFKLWKNEGLIDEWRTHNPWRILCEIYAKLLALLLEHWLMLLAQWPDADRSLTRALSTIRQFAWQFARDLTHPRRLRATFQHILKCLRLCHTDRSQASPRAFQRFEALS
jgi:hypothetical protein